MNFFSFTLLGLMLACTANAGTKELRELLLSKANKENAPEGVAVTVKHSTSLIRVLGVDVHNKELTIKVWERVRWQDQRLAWDAKKEGLEWIAMDLNDIWVPEVINMNEINQRSTRQRWGDVKALIEPSGEVIVVPNIVERIGCNATSWQLNKANREVSCTFAYGSWVYPDEQQHTAFDEEVIFDMGGAGTKYFEETDYKVSSFTGEQGEMTFCCPEFKWSLAKYTVKFSKLSPFEHHHGCEHHDHGSEAAADKYKQDL